MAQDQHIRLLSEHVINKIAAGEVVERPASVLKELIENALDAGGTQLDIEIVAGGRKLVAVADDGCGMGRDDALLAVERHATSKLRDSGDIERIKSLGFRGEALAAIAAVSRFRMSTSLCGENIGTEVAISGGKLQDVRDAGCPAGTRIEVRDLFFNVPARRKFLRSYQTELAHLRNGFIVQALAHPEQGMSFSVDGRETYRLPGGAGLEERICELFGSDRLQTLRPVQHRTKDVTVTGYVGLPSVTRVDRNEQFVFVNRRATNTAIIGYSIREGYHTLVPSGRHPVLFLCIDMDPELVDVNVHPTKREVRFRHPSDVRDTVIAAIRNALSVTTSGTVSSPGATDSREESTPGLPRASEQAKLEIEDLPLPHAFKYPRLAPLGVFPEQVPAPAASGAEGQVAGEQQSQIAGPETPWAWCRVVGQVGELYVVLETEDGMVLMDPHAAHERVLFEHFMTGLERGDVQSQSLLVAETVELSPRDAARVRQNIDLFKQMGFGISEFGSDTFVVDALPSYFTVAAPAGLLVDIAHGLERAGGRGSKGRWREESIAQTACKAAVKARDRLTLTEIERLVVDLSRAQMPYTCPHGRPTLIFTSFKEMNKKFARE